MTDREPLPLYRIPDHRLDQIERLTHAMGMGVAEQRELVRGYREYLVLRSAPKREEAT